MRSCCPATATVLIAALLVTATILADTLNQLPASPPPQTPPGWGENAVLFNGQSPPGGSYISVAGAAALNIPAGLTVEAWVRWDGSPGFRTVLSKPGRDDTEGTARGYTLALVDGVPTWFVLGELGERTVSAAVAIPANTWTHLAASYGGKTLRVFIDGNLAGEIIHPSPSPIVYGTQDTQFLIGRQFVNDPAGLSFGGIVDEVRVWSVVLGAYHLPRWRCRVVTPEHQWYPDLRAYFLLNEGKHGTTLDSIAGLVGILENGAEWVPSLRRSTSIVAPPNVDVAITSGCSWSGSIGKPSFSDSCGLNPPTLVRDPPAGEPFPVGTTRVTWTATFDDGSESSCVQSVTVRDVVPVSITCPPNKVFTVAPGETWYALQPGDLGEPIAIDNCGIQSVTNDAPTTLPLGQTVITWAATDNNGSMRTCGQIVSVEVDGQSTSSALTIQAPPDKTLGTNGWSCSRTLGLNDLGRPIVSDPMASVANDAPRTLPIGTTTVVWTATDSQGNKAYARQLVTIGDDDRPRIHFIRANRPILWPPDHTMRTVTLTIGVSDNCDPLPACKIVSVTSNQPVNDLGDGDTEPDWIVLGSRTVRLRAERSGSEDRVYTLRVRAQDYSGNRSFQNITITVPGTP